MKLQIFVPILFLPLFATAQQIAPVPAPVPVKKAAPPPPPCLNSFEPDRVVYIGDSHTVGVFGQEMSKQLRKDPILNLKLVKRYGVVSATADDWGSQTNADLMKRHIESYCDGHGDVMGPPASNFPSLNQLLEGSAPQAVIVALGTNDAAQHCKDSEEEQQSYIHGILRQIPDGVPCVWVGPTRMPEAKINDECTITKKDGTKVNLLKPYVDNLAKTAQERCAFVDSRKIRAPKSLFDDVNAPLKAPVTSADCFNQNNLPLQPNRKDHLHYDGSLAKFWGDCAAKEVSAALQSLQARSPNALKPSKKISK